MTGPSYKPYYAETVGTLLDHDGVFDGRDFVRKCLGERNLILNASAVLFRRDALQAALSRCDAELATLRVAGDWRLYIDILNQPGAQIVYVARPLNRHRRHAKSVTHSLDAKAHLAEIATLHRVSNDDTPTKAAYRNQVRKRLATGLIKTKGSEVS